jgi:putative Mg2+ transporter-C (MgtC) family protein
MPTTLTWQEVALRLLLTVLAAGVIGLDRDERGRSAGLRTNLLVGLAACIAMIQTNLLINSHGKGADSFVVMDTMRLPLGILSGIGFIGAGAIVKRGELIVGVTTAATLWFVTVMGLCFGGGQIGLGIAAFVLALIVLLGLKKFEIKMPTQHTATLRITVAAQGPNQAEIESLLMGAGIGLTNPFLTSEKVPDESRTFGWDVRWRDKREHVNPPQAIQDLAARRDIQRMEFSRS